MEERRKAPRFALPEAIIASVGGATVRLVDLSRIGARLEHHDRFPLQSPRLSLSWQGRSAEIPFRLVRSEIVGKRDGRLVYHSGIQFTAHDDAADGLTASILRWAEQDQQVAGPAPAAPQPASAAGHSSLDDTWTRQVRFLKDDVGDHLPFMQFLLKDGRWEKEYVSSPEQPDDGFTIRRDATDFAELQRTFEVADPETRRMMRTALASKLAKG